MNDLLKEAIADAKAVRKTALANAKLALEEAFTPKLQSMISAKIQEEAEDDMDEMREDEEMDEVDPGAAQYASEELQDQSISVGDDHDGEGETQGAAVNDADVEEGTAVADDEEEDDDPEVGMAFDDDELAAEFDDELADDGEQKDDEERQAIVAQLEREEAELQRTTNATLRKRLEDKIAALRAQLI